MRKLLTLCVLAAAAAVVVPAGVRAAPVHSTLSGTITDHGGWCCGNYATVEGAGTVAGAGRVSFVADWLSGCDPYLDPITCFTTEQVVLTARSGDTLTLSGGLTGGEEARDRGGLVVPWSIAGGTGRFASASGSGTFSFNFDYSTATATVALTGTISR